MQTSKWTSLDLTNNSGSGKFAPFAGGSYKNAFLRIRKIDDNVQLWPLLDLVKNIDIGVDLTMEIGLENDTFHADAEVTSNWTFGAGSTNLTIASIAKDSTTKCTVTFNDQVEWPQLVLSGPGIDDVNPEFAVLLSKDTFVSEATCENLTNWTLSVGTTGLTVASVTWVDETHCTIQTTGTCAAGTFAATAKIAAMTSGVASGVASYNTTTETSTCTDAPQHTNGTVTFLAKKAALVVGDYDSGVLSVATATGVHNSTLAPEIFFATKIEVDDIDPTMTITMNQAEFVSVAVCEDLTNWAFTYGDTALVVDHVEYVNPRSAKIYFTGTTVAGSLGVSILTAAVLATADVTSIDGTYVVDAEADSYTYTQSEIAGKVDVYQYLRDDDVAGFVETLTPETKASVFVKDMALNHENAFNPSLKANFVYVPGISEGTTYEVFAKLCIE